MKLAVIELFVTYLAASLLVHGRKTRLVPSQDRKAQDGLLGDRVYDVEHAELLVQDVVVRHAECQRHVRPSEVLTVDSGICGYVHSTGAFARREWRRRRRRSRRRHRW